MKFYTTFKLSENMHETPEGYLVCVGVPIARTGTMQYAPGELPLEPAKDGLIYVVRDEDEVFRPETMASFEGKSVTISHPTEFVTPETWGELSKGVIQNVRRGEGSENTDMIADLLITDKMAIGLVKCGLREVSCGYDAVYVEAGETGRWAQTKIIGNHLALVDKGRAGASYAINDHMGEGLKMKLGDKIKAIFAKAQDEALKVASETKDAEEPAKVVAKDEYGASLDALTSMVKDIGEKVAAMAPNKDASTQPTMNEPAEVAAKDDEVAPNLEDRLKAVEAAVQKLLEMQSMDADESDEDDGEESEDEEMPASTMTGDTASRLEILAPGFKAGKDMKAAKAAALKAAYATKDGKKAIDALTGGKAPTFDSAESVNTLFVAASELLKVSRSEDFSQTKRTTDSGEAQKLTVITPELMNEMNAKHYAKK